MNAKSSDSRARASVYLFGLVSAAAGIMDFIWGEFEPYHQPLQAISSHIAQLKIIVYLGALVLVAGGISVSTRRTGRYGAAALAVIYGIFGIATLRRLYIAPLYLGYHIAVYIGALATTATMLILVVAALIVFWTDSLREPVSERKARAIRWAFGLCSVNFGLAHLTGIKATSSMIPAWMPLGGYIWVVISGIAFILAGAGIISGLLDLLAARLLAVMLLIFSFIVLAPLVFTAPRSEVSWGANLYNLTAVASAWIVAEWLSKWHPGAETDRRDT